jgi:mannose-6-phosphate isomerase-like protein (cupin superfamily)
MQTLESGAATPPHYHECEEVLVILKGAGQFSIVGESRDFGPGTTLVGPLKSSTK